MAALPVMLTGDAMSYHFNMMQDCHTYADVISQLQRWNSSDEKKFRILTAWQGMSLSKAMSDAPSQSEAEVFRTLVGKLMSPQKHLNTLLFPS